MPEKFGAIEKDPYLCIAILKGRGRLAQLVQSVCLTSRGSGVRIPQRPHSVKETPQGVSFSYMSPRAGSGRRDRGGRVHRAAAGPQNAGTGGRQAGGAGPETKTPAIRVRIAGISEPKPGLEPGTYSLRMNCSTN